MKATSQNGESRISITLPGTASLSGSCLWNGGIAAVDGYSPYIYLFDENGCYKDAVPSQRPYNSISSNDGEKFVCTGCGCGRNCYFLNDRFAETGVMTPETASGSAVNASFYTDPPYDDCIAVTFTHSVKLFTRSGEYVKALREENPGVNYLCYQSFAGGDCAAYEKNESYRISVSDGDAGKTNHLYYPRCSTPKALILKACGNIDCVVGERFLYNYFIPVFTDESKVRNEKCF